MKTAYPASDPLYRHIPEQHEIELLCMEHELGELVVNHGDLGGLYNVNLRVETTTGTFVIRISSGLASVRHLEYVQQIISILQKANVPVLVPIKNNQGICHSIFDWHVIL